MSGLSRRAFLRGATNSRAVHRPPWTDAAFAGGCIGCGDCISVCPENILIKGDGGLPEIVFEHGGCSFCGDCADACQHDLFDLNRPAFRRHAVLGNRCLAFDGVDCQSCRDVCEAQAIRFRPTLGQAPQPSLSLDDCTGCGACLSVCPVNALTLESFNG